MLIARLLYSARVMLLLDAKQSQQRGVRSRERKWTSLYKSRITASKEHYIPHIEYKMPRCMCYRYVKSVRISA